MPLEDFAVKKQDNDILTHIVVKKTPLQVVYTSFRNTETDLPVLTMAVGRTPEGWRCAVGARPARAELVKAATEELREAVLALRYGTNTRASGEYRSHLAGVLLLGRCLENLKGGKHA